MLFSFDQLHYLNNGYHSSQKLRTSVAGPPRLNAASDRADGLGKFRVLHTHGESIILKLSLQHSLHAMTPENAAER